MARFRNIATMTVAHYDHPGTRREVKTGTVEVILQENDKKERRIVTASGYDCGSGYLDRVLTRWVAGGELPSNAVRLPDADKPAPKRVRDDVWFMAFNRAAYVIGGAAITAALLDHGSVNYLLFVGAMVLMACFIRRKHIEG